MKKSVVKYTSLLLSLIIIFGACTSTTMITSEPPGAKVYLNGMYAGETPVTYSDTKIVGTCTVLELEKEGYLPLHTMLVRNEEADVGAIIGGIFLLVPFLWTMGYQPDHHYELLSVEEAGVPEIEVPAPSGSYPKVEKIRELHVLYEDGLISKEEFETEKQKILESE